MWFNALGFSDEKHKEKINITTTVSHIIKVLEKNDIKF
jgi:hypothetical protein